MKRKIGAIIILAALIIVPFLDWRIGAVMWMSAWMVFLMQKLFTRENWNMGQDNKDESDKSD